MKIVRGVSSATVRRSDHPPLLPPCIPDSETAILEEDIPHNQCLPGVAHTQHVSTANWDTFSIINLTNQNSEPNPSPLFEFDIKHATQNTIFESTNQMNSGYNRAHPHNEPPDDQTHSSSSANPAANLELFPRNFDQDTHKFQGAQTIPAVDPSTHCHGNRIANKCLESKSLVDLESGKSKMPQKLSGKTVGRRILKPLTSVPEDYCPPKKLKWSSTSSEDSFNLSPQADQSHPSVCNFSQSNHSTSEEFPSVVAKLRPLVSFPSEFEVQTDQSDHSVMTKGDQSDSSPQSDDHSANQEPLVQRHYGGKNSQCLPVCNAGNSSQPHAMHMTHNSSQENIVACSANPEPSPWQSYEGVKSQTLPVGSLDNDEWQHGMGVSLLLTCC